MNNLLRKEIKLTSSPMSYIFLLFSLMALIPNYPIILGGFFICFGIFHSFQKGREANDIIYSTILPIKKRDIVTSKYLFTVMIQLLGVLLTAVFTVIRIFCLSDKVPYSKNTLMNANMVYIAFIILVCTMFNIIFVGGFFKTAYKIGMPFLGFAISTVVIIAIGETLWHLPKLGILNDNYHYSHFIVLSICILIYAIGTVISLKKSQSSFERIDL